MSCSANQNHVALRDIVANNTPLLNDCREHIVARGLTFEAAIAALDGKWTSLLCVVSSTVGEGDAYQPTYSLLRSDGDVNISPASLARFHRIAGGWGTSLPIVAYVTIQHGYNSLVQLETLLAAAGRVVNLETVMSDVLQCESLLAQGCDLSALIAGMDSVKRINTKVVIDIASNQVEERESYPYSGPVAQCCSPSAGLKKVNQQVQSTLATASSEATAIFGASSSVFNNLMSSVQSIVAGGPSQAGFSAAELNAKNAAVIENGATLARDLGGAAATESAAIGGGNAVTPAGGTQASVLAAKTAAAETTATGLNTVEQQNFAQGNANYEQAVSQETALPGIFAPAVNAEGQENTAASTALASQTQMDSESNAWQPLLGGVLGSVAGVATGGIMNKIGMPVKG
jgi:hypothetical protein